MFVLNLFSRGGPVMYVIALASVVALGVFIERMWSLRRSQVAPRELILEVQELVRSKRIAEAAARCGASNSAAGAIFRAALRYAGQPRDRIRTETAEVGRREALRLERGTPTLGTIASLGPLLGLLGTVLGMIEVFQRVAEVGAGSPLEMAAGIWQALLTTAFGLLTGIPALVMHRSVLARVDGLVLELEEEAVHLVELLEDGAALPVAPLPAPETRNL
jgi:biopolymer transport protein ExbB